MYDDLALMLPISEINGRLTRNARERARLMTMLRVAVEAQQDAEKFGPATTVFVTQPNQTRSGGATS